MRRRKYHEPKEFVVKFSIVYENPVARYWIPTNSSKAFRASQWREIPYVHEVAAICGQEELAQNIHNPVFPHRGTLVFQWETRIGGSGHGHFREVGA